MPSTILISYPLYILAIEPVYKNTATSPSSLSTHTDTTSQYTKHVHFIFSSASSNHTQMKLACMLMLVTVLVLSQLGLGLGLCSTCPRPPVDDVPEFARWLVASASWGVLSTLDGAGQPFGYVASYSDAGTGIPYFFLSTLDPAGSNLKTDPRSSLTVSEAEFGSCSDPQSPTCGKVTLSGDVLKLDSSSKEAELAEAVLFADHPLFTRFPKMNRTFAVYKLEISRIFLVNKSAPPRNLTVEEYFAVIA